MRRNAIVATEGIIGEGAISVAVIQDSAKLAVYIRIYMNQGKCYTSRSLEGETILAVNTKERNIWLT